MLNDQLQYTIAQKESFLHQLITAEAKFKVDLIAMIDVYNAQASYVTKLWHRKCRIGRIRTIS